MQKQDVIKLKTNLLRSVVSRQIEKALKKKTGYDIGIQIDKLTIVNEDGLTHIHLDGNAEINAKDLKKLCMNSVFLENIVSWILGLDILDKYLEKKINEILKKKLGYKVDLQIKDKKCTKKHKQSHIYLKTDAKIETKNLEKILENINLI